MPDKKHSFISDATLTFSRNIFALIIGFITSILLARYLGPEGRGLYASLLVYPILLTGLAELGIRQATVYLVGKKDHEPAEILGTLLWCLVVSSIVSAIIVAGVFLFLKDPDFTLFMILLALLYIPLRLTISYSQGVFLGMGQVRRFNQLTWIPPGIVFLGIIVFVVFGHMYVIGALLATLLGNACIAILALRMLSETGPLRINYNVPLIKTLLSYGIVYGFALFILQLNYKVDIIIMQQLSTAVEIGQYTVGVTIAELMWQIPSAVGVVIFSRSANSKNPLLFSKGIIKLFRVTCLLSVICGTILFFIAPIIMPIVYGIAFAPSITVLQLILPGIVIMTSAKVLNMDLAGKGKPVISLIAFAPSVLLNIILNIVWVPVYGANGSAMASTVSYSVGSILFVYLYSRELNISIKEIFRFQKSDFDFIKSVSLMIKKKLMIL